VQLYAPNLLLGLGSFVSIWLGSRIALTATRIP
jgi:hypothetical protein